MAYIYMYVYAYTSYTCSSCTYVHICMRICMYTEVNLHIHAGGSSKERILAQRQAIVFL